jgi:hypothetical protein
LIAGWAAGSTVGEADGGPWRIQLQVHIASILDGPLAAGSDCVLLLWQLVLPVVHPFSVLLGFHFILTFRAVVVRAVLYLVFVLNINQLSH